MDGEQKMVLPTTPHPGWDALLRQESDTLTRILRALDDEPKNPPDSLIFRFTAVDPDGVRAVILGQDPYPQPGAATGRSFEVAGLSSWLAPIRQSSLRSILRAICAAETGELLSFREVQARIADGRFAILPPDRLWDALEAQGVLFLNAYLTCRPGEPLSHRQIWAPFARALVSWLDERRGADAVWFLWGADARSYAPLIRRGRRYESRHPMMAGPEPDGFLQNPCFRETADRIRWTGIPADGQAR